MKSPARSPSNEQSRLATLLEIGRTLSGSTDPAELRVSILAGISKLFEGDRVFCADVDGDWNAHVVAIATHGVARSADPTYPAISTAATSDDGCVLHAEAARALGGVLGGVLGGMPDATDALIVPVRVGGRVVGELGALRSMGRPFSPEDADLLAFGAAITAAALTAFDRLEETEARRREAEQLEEIGRAITGSLEIEEVLQRVMQAAIDLTSADSCTIWRREGERSVVVASRGPDALPVGYEVDVSEQIRDELLASRRSIRIDDVSTDPRIPSSQRARLAGAGPRSVILIPMLSHEKIVGVLAVAHHQPQHYGPDQMRILDRLALQAAIAVENAHLHAEIRELSLTDPLTGLPNRRHLDMMLAKEFEAARRGRPLTVVLLDLDDFKAWNDAHGHAGGDAVLRDFASVLAGITRAMNLAVRYGGDEFLSVLSESTAEGAALLVERIERKVAEHPRLKGVGFSAGIAQYEPGMATPQALIDAADAAMYRRKVLPRPVS